VNSTISLAQQMHGPGTVNITRLHQIMDREGLEGLVVRGGHNVAYLAAIAYHGTLARHLDLAGSPRGVLVVWPRNGDPVLVVDRTAEGATKRDSWITNVEIFDGYEQSLFDRAGDVLENLGLSSSRLGLDKNFIGAGFWQDLEQRFPQLGMCDATDLLDEVRWIKTDGEIARFRDGAALLDQVLTDVFPTIKPGDKEAWVHGRIIGGCLSYGAEFAHGIFNSHRNPVIYCGESDFCLQRGDIIRTDYLAYLSAYPGHQSRNAVLGRPSSEQKSDYERYYEIYRETSELLRPGIAVGELYDTVVERFDRIGWTYKAGLVGHSIGPWWHQQNPIFCKGSSVPLQEGMVVAFEPFIDHWHCQDIFLITDGAPEKLSNDFDSSELFVIV